MKSTSLHIRDLDRTPCPRSSSGYTKVNGFQIVCDKVLYGDDTTQRSAISLSDCMAQCKQEANCKAVTFDSNSANGPNGCFLKDGIPAPVKRDPLNDSALLLPTDVQDDCGNLAKEVQVKGKRYAVHCGSDLPGADLRAEHAKSLQECAGICSDDADCRSVSFDPEMAVASMYWNCYLKSSANVDGLTQAQSTMHTAFVMSSNTSSEAAASSVSIAPSSTLSSSILSSSPSTSNTSAALPADANANSSSSKAWIAGAVVGPIIGIALVAALCFFFYKRGRRNRHEQGRTAEMASQEVYYGNQDGKSGTQALVAPLYPPQELGDGTHGRRELPGHAVAQLP